MANPFTHPIPKGETEKPAVIFNCTCPVQNCGKKQTFKLVESATDKNPLYVGKACNHATDYNTLVRATV